MQEYVDELCVEDIPTQTTDSLLESLSLDIMEESIKDQIVLNLNPSRDFLSTIIDKFNAIVENADADSVRGIKQEMIEWCNRLISTIVSEYELGYNNPGEESLECIDILESLYHFFVLDRRRNTKNFFIKYIEINKKEIIDAMGISNKGTDITTIANKKKNISKDNISILSNLTEVIQFIMRSTGVSSEGFIDLVDEGDLYTSNVSYYFDTNMLIGDFFLKYIKDEVGDYNTDISTDLRISIRSNLAH